MPELLLIENGTVVTLGKSPRVIENGAVLCAGRSVIDVGPARDLKKKARGARRFDAGGKVVMPGFICAHHHLYSAFARGLALPKFAPRNFTEILKGLWWKLDKVLKRDDIYWSALATLVEALKCGTTTVIDHHEGQSSQEGSLDDLARAASETGIRACLTLGVSDRYGRGKEGIRENERFLRRLLNERGPDGLLNGMVGLHASFTVKDDTLDACVDVARRYRVGIHTHCAEDKADQDHALRTHKQRVVQRLFQHSVLSPDSLLVHGVHLDRRELETIREMEVPLVHNPESNMNNAVGAADIVRYMNGGVLVGLGTDGMSSHMPLQARTAYLLQRHARKDPQGGFGEALEMLLFNNATIAGRLCRTIVGELSPGAAADIAVIDYRPMTPLTAGNFGGHLLFGMAYAPVTDVFVAGRRRVRDGKAVGVDEVEVFRKARETAARFWKKILA
jgi:putative selenium metabolism protein SsnA